MTVLPFAHLNLKRNPFGELTANERTDLALVEIDAAVRHLELPRSVVQFVGEKGYGKTTHLLALSRHFPTSAYIHIPEGKRAVIPTSGEPLLIDEAQRLTLNQRWHATQSNRRLILGTHQDLQQALSRAGRPVLTLAADRLTDVGHVLTILNARVQSARRAPGPIPAVTHETACRLYAQFGSDIRSMEHSLYQVFQELRDIQDV